MHTSRLLVASIIFVAVVPTANAAEKDRATELSYIHPNAGKLTELEFVSPLPASFVAAYPRRTEMGDQYLDLMGAIAIVGETDLQRADMRRVAHTLMGLIDNDQDGLPDDAQLWKKLKATTNDRNRLVLYVTQHKSKYKSFDSAHPSIYHQGWSSLRDGEKLHLSNIQEELFHFLQRHLWEMEYPDAFGLDRNPRSVAHHAAAQAVRNRHYVYDQNCVSESGCLVPEFFFCVMTDLMKGWQGDGFDAPGKNEWRLKGEHAAIRTNYPRIMEMVLTMQEQGKLPRKWPSFFLINAREAKKSAAGGN